MTKSSQPQRLSAGRRIYSFFFWIVVYVVGMAAGSGLAWAFGAGLDLQIVAGFFGGVILLFFTNRWVRRVKFPTLR